MTNPTVYIWINKSLNMTVGKVAAQAAHAMAKVPMLSSQEHWLSAPQQTVLVMQARDEAHMRNIEDYLLERYISSYRVIDEGVNETDPQVMTALATQVVDKDEVQAIFSTFKVYRDTVRVRLEIDK